MIGKTVKVNLTSLTNDIKKQNKTVSFAISRVDGDLGHTEVIGLEIVPTSLRRWVRKGRTRLDQTIKAITLDEKPVTVKLILITNNTIKGLVHQKMQAELKRLMYKKISKSHYNELTEEIIQNKIQRELKSKLSKVYPLRTCEIRFFKLERFLKSVDLRKIKDAMLQEKKRPEPKVETDEEEEKKEEHKKSKEQKDKKPE